MRKASRRGYAAITPWVMLATTVVALVSASAATAQSARVEELVYHESGFGLLRAIEPLKLKPMALGKSAENGDIVPRQALTRALAVVIGFGGILLTGPVAGIAVNAMRTTLTDGGKR